jgi:hypothetical protein
LVLSLTKLTYFSFSAPSDVEGSEAFGFFEVLEQEKARDEMAKLLEKKKICPIAPDGKILHLKTIHNIFLAFIPNSTIRTMFQTQEIEPVEVKMFRLRLVCR